MLIDRIKKAFDLIPSALQLALRLENVLAICFSYLELDVLGVLLDLDALGVLPPGLEQEVLDLLDLAGHGGGWGDEKAERSGLLKPILTGKAKC